MFLKGILYSFLKVCVPFMVTLLLVLPQAWATSDCDRASTVFADARVRESAQAYPFLMKAIELCPGYIRPYELVGNYHRKKGETGKAIEYFTKAAELGSTNYKLYYLLASLLYEEGESDEASRYLNRSLDIRDDYSRSLKLKEKIGGVQDSEGPKIILYEPATRRGLQVKHNYANLTVRGLATDKSGISWVKVNEKEASLDEQGNFLKDIPINPGSTPLW